MALKNKNNTGAVILILGGAAALIGVLSGFRKGYITVDSDELQTLYGFDPTMLSRYYTESDVTRSAKADQLGIVNAINAEQLVNASYLAQFVLDPISDVLGKLIINGWFRNPQVNAAVGGTSNSDHLRGEAADVENANGNNSEIVRTVLYYNLPFDQMIIYDSIDNPSRIHLSYNPARQPSEQVRDVKLKVGSDYIDIDDLQELYTQVA